MKDIPPNAYKSGTQLTVGSHQVAITKYLSQGGYAHVYTCEIIPPFHGNKVACLKRVAVPDKITLNILRAEVDAMKRLKGNRYIVSYIDSHASRMASGTGYEVFVLMEYCSRNGLIDLMNTRLVNKLTEFEILKIMAEITEGVCNMHSLNPPLIHRDIKIENVLISGDGDCKLCDFGSASGILRPPRNAEEFKVLQDDIMKHTTAQYRSPEMIDLYRGFPIDEKADIWALGIFLYKLCFYTTPFENNHINGNNGGGEYAILHSKFVMPNAPEFSPRLKNMMTTLLNSDPRARPNAYQLLEEVCKMRNKPVPIENWYKNIGQVSSTDLTKPPVVTRKPLMDAPQILKTQTNTNIGGNGIKDPFASIDKSKLLSTKDIKHNSTDYKSKNSKSQPSLQQNLGTMISSQINDLSKNGTEMSHATETDNFARPMTRTSKPSSRAASTGAKRPTSMYVADEYKTYVTSSDQMETLKLKITGQMETVEFEPLHIDSNVAFLRNLNGQNTGRSHRRSQYTGESVKSNYGNLNSAQNTGTRRVSEDTRRKSAIIQNTGTRRISDDNRRKRSSITSLKSLLTGERKDKLRVPSHSASSKSRASSFEIHSTDSADSLNGFQSVYYHSSGSSVSLQSSASGRASRKSSDSISEKEEIIEEKLSQQTSPEHRTKSIHSRVKMLLNRTQDPPLTKTASGYGKYTDSKSNSGVSSTSSTSKTGYHNYTTAPSSLKNGKTPELSHKTIPPPAPFKKPDMKRVTTPQQMLYRTESKTSTTSTYSTITPQSTFNKQSTDSTPRVHQGMTFSDNGNGNTSSVLSATAGSGTLVSPSATAVAAAKNAANSARLKKKPPPPKPKKPTYLKSPVRHERNPSNGKVQLVVEHLGQERRVSVTSDIDVDDLEREFMERFPSAL